MTPEFEGFARFLLAHGTDRQLRLVTRLHLLGVQGSTESELMAYLEKEEEVMAWYEGMSGQPAADPPGPPAFLDRVRAIIQGGVDAEASAE